MASLPLTQKLTVTTTTTSITTSLCPFPRTKSTLNAQSRRQYGLVKRSISCSASNQSSDDAILGRVDRRDVLVGLSMAGIGTSPLAVAAPIDAPDLTKCGKAEWKGQVLPVDCCPTTSLDIIDFKPPPFTRLRVRPAAHKADKDYIAKYNEALKRMRELPDSDPRSFSQQAEVHCAYCNSAYDQTGYPGVELQVHENWLFFPFHRWYLYFYERILGKLIGDPTFAIPFWNWDHPDGMTMPAMFTSDKNSTLYDVNRSPKHQPPFILDLNYSPSEDANKVPQFKEQVEENMTIMYRQMVSGANKQCLFFGGDVRAGEQPESSPGTIECYPHNPIHIWSGNENNTLGEDMGNFYSAGRDPMFYAHHGNVDRMWSIWKSLPGKKRTDISDPDWLNSTFLFYDENKNLVRVKVADCLDTRKLGYVYEQVDLPWLMNKPKPQGPRGPHGGPPHGGPRGPHGGPPHGGPRGPHGGTHGHHDHRGPPRRVGMSGVGAAMAAESNDGVTPLTDFPIALTEPITVLVPRLKKGRSKAEKKEEEEILVIEGIDYDRNSAVKFDVYVNDEDEGGPDKSEFAGSFVTVPHNTKNKEWTNTILKLGISELLEDVGADDDESVLVTLVPKAGEVKVGGVKIVYEK